MNFINKEIYMEDINPIYHNPFGVAFQYKRASTKELKKVQMVFRDTGFLLTLKELEEFRKHIKCTMESNSLCDDCRNKKSCRALLLDTPAPQVTLAMSQKELNAVDDLVEGTLFQLKIDNFLNSI